MITRFTTATLSLLARAVYKTRPGTDSFVVQHNTDSVPYSAK